MASYFIAAALAAIATLSSAEQIQDPVKDLSVFNACPNPHWEDIKEYHTYPFEYNVHLYWNCSHQTALESCPVGTVFNQEYHYCDWDKETSKNFVCPRFRRTRSGYKLFPDPNFEYQYRKCYYNTKYPSERMACPYDHIFNQYTSRCEYARYSMERK